MISHDDLLRFVKTKGSCPQPSPGDALPADPLVSQNGDGLKVEKPVIKQEGRKPPPKKLNFKAKFVTPKIEDKNHDSKDILKELKFHKGKHSGSKEPFSLPTSTTSQPKKPALVQTE